MTSTSRSFVTSWATLTPADSILSAIFREKLKRYCNKSYWFGDGEDEDGTLANDEYYRESLCENCVLFRRLAVVDDDFDDFNLLSLAVKDSDNCARSFREQHGDRCAELDAIPSTELRRRVRDTIEAHITNRDEWERLKRVESAERESREAVLVGMQGDDDETT